jgi:hypothetical protein
MTLPTADYGDPRLPERFWDKVYPEPNTGCWLWAGATLPRGYGTYYRDGRVQRAHVVAYKVLVSDYPDGLELDHLCRSPWCVYPGHLEPVTHAVNVRRGNGGARERARTHCPSGHEYTEDNTYYRPSRRNRQCRTCARDGSRERMRRKRRQER